MAGLWRFPLLLSLWAGLGSEILAGSRTVPVQVTFVEVAQHSALQILNAAAEANLMEPGGNALHLANLKLDGSGKRPLSIVVEIPHNPRDLQSKHAVPARRSSDDLIVTISYH